MQKDIVSEALMSRILDRIANEILERYEDTKGKSLMIQRLHELVGMDGYTEEQWTEMRAVYLAQCSKVDAMIRKVCETLKETGMYDDSAIFILSDHGDFCGDYGLPDAERRRSGQRCRFSCGKPACLVERVHPQFGRICGLTLKFRG